MNTTLERWINGLAGHSGLLDAIMKFAANELILFAPLLLLGLWFWRVAPSQRSLNQRVAVAAVLAVAIALGAGALAGQIHHVARPFVTDPTVRLLIKHGADNSFPSEHSLIVFAVAGVVIWFRRLLGALALMVAFVTALSRVFVGVHWPTDVAASAPIGLGAAFLATRIVGWLRWPQAWAASRLPSVLVTSP